MSKEQEKVEAWEMIRDDVSSAIQQGLENPKQIAELKLQIGRLVSHIDSQRRVEEINSRQLYEHHSLIHGVGENPGMKERINDHERTFNWLRKAGWVGMSMLVVLTIKAVVEVIKSSNLTP